MDSGDGLTRTAASVAFASFTQSLSVVDNRLYFSTKKCRVRMVDLSTNIVSTRAGSTCVWNENAAGYAYYYYWDISGNNIAATSAVLDANPNIAGEF